MQHLECDVCGKRQKEDDNLNECADCRDAIYCGRDCQEQDWIAGHAEDCLIGRMSSHRMKKMSSLSDAQTALSEVQAASTKLATAKGLRKFSLSRALKRRKAGFLHGANALRSKLSPAEQGQLDQMIAQVNSM